MRRTSTSVDALPSGGGRPGGGPGDAVDAQGRDCAVAGQPAAGAEQRVSIEALYEQVNELGLVSTSFSYPILASLELGVRQLVEEGEAIWKRASRAARRFAMPAAACGG